MSLAGLQVLDLMEVESSFMVPNRVQHRHIFAAGRCLDPELPDAVLAWSAAKSVFTLTARCHSASGYHIMVNSVIFNSLGYLSLFSGELSGLSLPP